jgi:hypothetical protein
MEEEGEALDIILFVSFCLLGNSYTETIIISLSIYKQGITFYDK